MNIYINTTGSDITGDGTQGDPYASLSKAFEVIELSSDNNFNVFMSEGVYSPGYEKYFLSISSNKNILIKPESENQIVTITQSKPIEELDWEKVTNNASQTINSIKVWDILSSQQKETISDSYLYRADIKPYVNSSDQNAGGNNKYNLDGYLWDIRTVPTNGGWSKIKSITTIDDELYTWYYTEFGETGIDIVEENNYKMTRYPMSRYPKFNRDWYYNFFSNTMSDLYDEGYIDRAVGNSLANEEVVKVKPTIPTEILQNWENFPWDEKNRLWVECVRDYESSQTGTTNPNNLTDNSSDSYISDTQKVVDSTTGEIYLDAYRGAQIDIHLGGTARFIDEGDLKITYDCPLYDPPQEVTAANSQCPALPMGFCVWNILSEVRQGECFIGSSI